MAITTNLDNQNPVVKPNVANLDDSDAGQSINVPEVDQSISGPQVYNLPQGLQVSTENAPEATVNTNCLFPHPDDASPKESLLTSTIYKRRAGNRHFWYLLGILVVILAISLGIGLEVGLPKSRTSSQPSPNSTFSPSEPVHGVFNDTSLAVIMTPDDNRHLFFQDINGSLRRTVFSQSLGTWSKNADFIQTPQQPRLRTPLSVYRMNLVPFILCYADINDTLVAFQYYPPPILLNSPHALFDSSYLTLPSGRSLNIVPLQSHVPQGPKNNSSTNRTLILDNFLLFYSSPSNNVTVLHGSENLNDTWTWQNVTESFHPQGPNNNSLSSTFAAAGLNGSITSYYLSSQLGSSTPSYSLLEASSSSIYVLGDGTTIQYVTNEATVQNLTASSPLPYTPYIPLSDQFQVLGPLLSSTSDLLILSVEGSSGIPCSVSDGTLHMDGVTLPNAWFPFGRLAGLQRNNSMFIYHQLNEGVLLEEVQDLSLGTDGFGEPTQIVVPTQ